MRRSTRRLPHRARRASSSPSTKHKLARAEPKTLTELFRIADKYATADPPSVHMSVRGPPEGADAEEFHISTLAPVPLVICNLTMTVSWFFNISHLAASH
jgi:hypothetical protein